MRKLTFLVLMLCASDMAQAQIMKCVDAKGNTVFSDGGCNPATQRGSTINIKPATGKDKYSYNTSNRYSDNDEAYDRNPYSKTKYENYNRNERYRAASINNQKQRKYANDRQNALNYENEIKRVNEERMRNMNSNTSRSTNNSPSRGISTCQYIGNRVRC